MEFNEYKEEEKTLYLLMYKRIEVLREDEKLKFGDGIRVQFFASEIITWFRYSKTLLNGGSLSKGQQVVYDLCQDVNTEYGFDFTVENIQDRTVYVKEENEKEENKAQ